MDSNNFSQGFGYDPLFVIDEPLPERGLTLAELDPATKNSLSHRARAVANFAKAFRALASHKF